MRISRVRKKEPELGEVKRVRRVRPSSVPASTPSSTPRYVIDWEMGWGSKLQLYLMASFLYYHMNRSVIKDHEYDRLAKDLLAGWRTNRHQHKHLISRDDLLATTGYAIKYPLMVRHAALLLLEKHGEV